MDTAVQEHVAIQRLMYRYARCADRKDYAGFASVFCEGAVFEYRGQPVVGLPAIIEMMHNLEKYPITLHQVHNVLYDVNGDTATGETYCIATHLLPEQGETLKIEMGIVYADQLQRLTGEWRILRRDFQIQWSQTTVLDAD